MQTFDDISIEYERSLDSSYKKNNGIFYTNSSLASLIIDELNDLQKESKIIDPCCGSGVFIKELVKREYKNVYGSDIDSGAVKIAKRICGAKVFNFDTINQHPNNVFKKMKLKEKFDVVIGNPPYAPYFSSIMNVDENYMFRRDVKASGDNLFVAALLRAKDLVSENGIIAYIIPKNFLHVKTYSFIRRIFLRDFSILSITEVGRYFKEVRGEQIVLIAKKVRKDNHKISFKKLSEGKFVFQTEINQDFYKDEITIFEDTIDFSIYCKFKDSYTTLSDFVNGYVGRGRSKTPTAIAGKNIRKFGFKDRETPINGNQIFIQNIYSVESGIIASFAGTYEAKETVTIFTDGDDKMCRYVLGLLHSKLCNYFLAKFIFNNSKLTMHVDAKYLKSIPLLVDEAYFEYVVSIVRKIEKQIYMSVEWFKSIKELDDVVYKIYKLSTPEIEFVNKRITEIQSKKWEY